MALLWEMCQIPDYRKISAASHAEMIATLYNFVMSDAARIPSDWFARQVALADRTDGDLDTLSSRLAQIRTWTFVSHRGHWLDDPEHWQARTRAIEDTLSDALHEGLAKRFIDRRTSALMRRMRDKEEMVAEIGGDGAIMVENHYVGRLDGFDFTPDASGEGIHGRATRHAAAKVLSRELAVRADALVAAPDEAITLSPNGRVVWAGSEIARLERGENALKPHLQLNADEHLALPERERVMKRLDLWLETQISTRLKPLVDLSDPAGLSGLARGIAFRLVENFGTLRRDAIADELKALEQQERASLRQHGVRFGAFNIYVPSLLKPGAAGLLTSLWALHSGRDHGIALDALPPRPQQGLTSVEADRLVPEAYWRVAGFHLAGARAVRIDMLERLADLIRVRVAYRAGRRAAGAVGCDGRWRLPRGAGSDVGGRLLGRGFRLDTQILRLQARAAQGSGRQRRCLKPRLHLRQRASKRFGVRAGGKTAANIPSAIMASRRQVKARGTSGSNPRGRLRHGSARSRPSIRRLPRLPT